MKATTMNAIARDIRVNRTGYQSILNDFRAYWGKVYRHEVTEALNNAINAGDKNERYALEQVCAKIKGLNLNDEIKGLIRTLHDDDKLTFSCLREDFVTTALNGLDYVATDDEGKPYLREFRKENKEATEKTWQPIVKWTEAKVGRYFRLAVIRINEQSK